MCGRCPNDANEPLISPDRSPRGGCHWLTKLRAFAYIGTEGFSFSCRRVRSAVVSTSLIVRARPSCR